MRRLSLIISAMAGLFLLAQEAGAEAGKHVVFLAGKDSHGWGAHKHIAGSMLLSESLPKGAPGVTTQMVRSWPSAEVLEKADALVIYADGWHMHPANGHLAELKAFMESGKGLVVFHWATGIGTTPKAGKDQKDDPLRVQWRQLMGADFEAFYSISNFYTANFDKPSDHPVMNGVPPFQIFDECYYHLRECGAEHGKVEPVLALHPPANTIQKGHSPFRGNDTARAAIQKKEEQYCAWTYERPGGGKAFGFTGGHFHWNWARDEVRKMAMNGILWAAGGSIPENGIETPRPKAAQMLANMEFKNPGWTEDALQYGLDLAQSGKPVEWAKFSNRPLPPVPKQESVSLFDGKTLEGWDFNKGIWRVEDGAISVGSHDKKWPKNEFICTKKEYGNFELKLTIKCSGDPKTGLINSGIQIRSARLPNGRVAGYQVDCGDKWFGKIYDEHRRALIYPKPIDEPKLLAAIDTFGWNEYRILADGPRIQVWINGVKASDYTETNPQIPLNGVIAPQIHSGGHVMVQFKDVTIRELPPTPGAPTWESLGGVQEALKKVKKPRKPRAKKAPAKKPATPSTPKAAGKKEGASHNNVEGDPKPAIEQLKLFHLPEGYEIELVVQESDEIGKFVSVYFDQRGRLWTQTALEYPVDGKQNPAVAEALYKSHAKDKVLVYPRESLANLPEGGLSNPTVFADGLAIPLGILPWGNGDSAYVLNGPDLFLLTDTNNDGKADKREIILTGFGVQDSHLFPHQFTRAPGDWIWMAQGLFNNSAVKRPGDDEAISWPKCSMARMRPDGSQFEITSTGPNNIWGLATTGEGETFIQEANDYGYPVMAFQEYAYYPGGMKGLKKSYQPSFPPAAKFRMGGTGLSGLALLEDGPLVDEKADLSMLVANPITSKVQTLGMHRDDAYWNLEQLEDFLSCDDPWFRPVAMTQGPDGYLYIVDWYNKIISHNEVRRDHPDRDKTRGRIWRIKPTSADPSQVAPDFTSLDNKALLAMLGKKPTARAHLAWQTLADRTDPAIAKALEQELMSGRVSDAVAIQALWILGDSAVSAGEKLLSSPNRNVRRELARYPKLATSLISDPDSEVRFAAVTTLARQLPEHADVVLPKLLSSIKPTLEGPTTISSRTKEPIPFKEAYDREFERFLARFFLEKYPTEVAAFLKSDASQQLPLEGRILAALALPAKVGAPLVATLLPKLDRASNTEELFRLAEYPDAPGCGEALVSLLAKEDSRAEVAKQLLSQKTRLDPKKIAPLLTKAARSLLAGGGNGATTGMELAGAYSLGDLEPDIVTFLKKDSSSTADRIAALTALRQLRSKETELLASLATSSSEDPAIREAALNALAENPIPATTKKLLELYPDFDLAQRGIVLTGLSSSKPGARAIVAGLESKQIPSDHLDSSIAERLATVLDGDPALTTLMNSLEQIFGKVLQLNGKPTAFADSNINLEGPFTVETWVRLDPNISSADSLLASKGVLDLNFHQSRLHVWGGSGTGNIAVSTKPMAPDLWTHLAVTRDAKGVIKIFTDGELDAVGKKKAPAPFTGLKPGLSNPPKTGTAGSLTEFRVWNRERSAQEIRQNFDRSFSGSQRPSDLIFYNSGGDESWGELGKGAKISQTTDLPPLLTLEQAKALDAKFTKFMKLGQKGGNVENGKLLSAICTSCHVIDGQGGEIGPELSGAAEMGLEAVLRNILTPNAAMESGYRIYRVEMKTGEIIDAFFVSEDKKAVVIRQIGLSDRRIPKTEIASTRYIRRSLMPEGLLDGLSDEQASDLLAYLMKTPSSEPSNASK
ncbi:PVC-type heme-binding CxxCH protein [Haloferula sp.]|uniref:PVC-type heme-binding CxxCH protein n=1 Tax=Haloferula sp. TaxID=2497595 RepID=UPI00329D5E4E